MKPQEHARPVQVLARQWQALAERRRRHLLALYSSGRWRRYYSEEQMLAQMRDALRNAQEWSAASGAPVEAEPEPAPLREAAE